MSLGLAYWILMLVWVVFSFAWRGGYLMSYGPIGGALLLVCLFGLLGWKVFGPPLKNG